jgi:ubiquinone/menaquinone biosynthesis C-methylase UbiE
VKPPEIIARQSARPHGLLGSFIGRIMAFETAEANRIALELLEPQPTDAVLEIGFGHGATIARILKEVPRGFVAGVDVSLTMMRQASCRNRAAIASGAVELHVAEAERLPYPAGRFDKVLSVHTLYFWNDPERVFAEIKRVLKPGGRLVLAWRLDPGAVQSFPASVYRFHDQDAVTRILHRASLMLHRLVTRESGPATLHFAVATSPP